MSTVVIMQVALNTSGRRYLWPLDQDWSLVKIFYDDDETTVAEGEENDDEEEDISSKEATLVPKDIPSAPQAVDKAKGDILAIVDTQAAIEGQANSSGQVVDPANQVAP